MSHETVIMAWRKSKTASIQIGDRYGKLVVLTRPEIQLRGKYRVAMCKCRCDCGNVADISASNLIQGNSRSCPCSRSSVTAERNRTHSFSGTRIYRTWAHMVKRCEYEQDKAYKNYGGRGIRVCDEWRSSFEAFFDWAMANGYDHELTLDRRDNERGYSPDNCRWITMADQAGNKRSNNVITAFGETKHLAAWAKDHRCTVALAILGWRIRSGMSPERALTDPIKTGPNKKAREAIGA